MGAFREAFSAEKPDDYVEQAKKEQVAVSNQSIIHTNCCVAAQPFKEDMASFIKP